MKSTPKPKKSQEEIEESLRDRVKESPLTKILRLRNGSLLLDLIPVQEQEGDS